jgi:membrane protease YdiL (CAAX protease family)
MLRTYLKYKPAWIQLVVLIAIAVGVLVVVNLIAIPIIQNALSLTNKDLENVGKGIYEHPNIKLFLILSQVVSVISLFIIPAYLFSYFADPVPSHYLRIDKLPKINFIFFTFPLLLLGIFATNLLAILNQKIPLSATMIKDEAIANKAIAVLATSNNITELIVSIIVVGLFAAISEELFFRAIMQRIIIQWVKNPWVGIIITAILFSAFHFQFSGFLPRFGLGIILGGLFWYSGNLWPCILFHFLHNTIGIIAAYFDPSTINNNNALNEKIEESVLYGLVSIVLIVFIFIKMKKQSTTSYAKIYPPEPSFFD